MMPIKLTQCFCYLEFLLYTYCKSTFRLLCSAFIASVHTYLKKENTSEINLSNILKHFHILYLPL